MGRLNARTATPSDRKGKDLRGEKGNAVARPGFRNKEFGMDTQTMHRWGSARATQPRSAFVKFRTNPRRAIYLYTAVTVFMTEDCLLRGTNSVFKYNLTSIHRTDTGSTPGQSMFVS